MSVQEESGSPRDNLHEEIKNNNKHFHPPDGDTNANRIPSEEGQKEDSSPRRSLLSHGSTEERIIIWGTHARSEDPELEEFELLECQQLEAFLKEDEKRGSNTRKEVGKKNLCKRQVNLSSSICANESARTDQNANHGGITDADISPQPLDLRTSTSRSGARRSLREARSSSENNVFVPSFSALSSLSGSLSSALDSATCTQPQPILPSKSTSVKYRIQHPVTPQSLNHNARNREHPRHVDQNHNSTTLPQEPGHERRSSTDSGEYPTDRENVGADNRQENGQLSKFQRNLERVPPSRRQLVHPLSQETEQCLTSGHTGDTQGQHLSNSSEEGKNGNIQFFGSGSGIRPSQTSTKGISALRRQRSAEQAAGLSDRKGQFSPRAYSSPTRPSTPPSPKTTGSPQRRPPGSPARTRVLARGPQLGYGVSQGYSSGIRPPVKTTLNTNVQNPIPQTGSTDTSSPPKCPPKPKSVRPKIITYIRKSPQTQTKPPALEGPYEVSSLPPRLSASSNSLSQKPASVEAAGPPVLSASNLLYDKYRQELQKARLLAPGLMVSGIKPPSHTMPQKASACRTHSFYGSLNKFQSTGTGRSTPTLGQPAPVSENHSESQISTQETGSLFRNARALRPQLGVGAVGRPPPTTAKSRIFAGQRSPLTLSQPVQAVTPSVTPPTTPPADTSVTPSTAPSTQGSPEALDQRKATTAAGLAAKSLLPKPAASGLRPPGYSRLPPARLAAFGFVRSSSVSSVSSNHSTDSTRSDPCRPAYRPSGGGDDPPFHRVITASGGDGPRVPCRSSPQPPNTPVPTRRPLLPPPPGSPVGSRKDFQKGSDGSHPPLSSPKRLAVVSPKPQSPVLQKQRAAATVTGRCPGGPVAPVSSRGGSPGSEKRKQEALRKEKEREEQEKHEEELLQLQRHCEEQAGQLQGLRAQLRITTMGLDAFAVCTQHFCLKSENAEQKQKNLALELSRIREEVDSTTAHWKQLQQEKTDLEQSFEQQLKELQEQQESELAALEEELRTRHASDTDHLRAEHQSHVEELRTQQQEQIEELTTQHELALEDLRTMHNITMATLQEEHARTMRDLRKAHEQQKETLESEFEKHRISLQDQVDMLTFQNRALRDKAKRFEEALRRSADEQIVDALAPYQHIEQDLKSLKEVLEMKNQQIHDQERKICQLEKVAQKNVYLEEKVQVLQQQNEDLKARIENNLALSRQLSEENANLQEYVEKETSEKKRLSRNNEELLWRLQTSPHLSPASSPSHRAFFPGPDIPPYPYSPGPGTPTHSYSPGPCTPTHRVASPGPGTPTHRGSPAARSSPARIPNANTLPR